MPELPSLPTTVKTPERGHPAHLTAVQRGDRSVIQFVTVCTKARQPVLASQAASRALIAAWQAATAYHVGRYVILPDHVHLFCAPATNPPENLGRWISFWKSHAARHWPDASIGKLWQRDAWDTQLRAGDSYTAKWAYVHENPVRAGLVAKPEDWPYQGEINVLRWHA